MDYSPPGLLSMGFSRQEYWSGLPLPFPGDLPDPGIQPASPVSPAFFTTEPPGWQNLKTSSNIDTEAKSGSVTPRAKKNFL